MDGPPPEKRRKTLPSADLQTVHTSLSDLLIKIKPSLSSVKDASAPSVLRDLHEVATVAESFTRLKGRAKSDWKPMADDLDKEGVTLWNTSTYLRHNESDDEANLKVFAALRIAGYRLIEAGMDAKLAGEGLAHVVQLASKAASALAASGATEAAAGVLESAAKFEEALRRSESANDGDLRARAAAITTYFSGRMEAASQASNESVAYYMLQQAMDEQRIALLPSSEIELLAAKILSVGRRVLWGPPAGAGEPNHSSVLDPKRGHAATKWFRSGLKLLERIEDEASLGLAKLKVAMLRSLARSFFAASTTDPSCLVSAEATVDELLATSTDHENDEHQQLHWMKLAILKRRKAGENELTEAFRSLITNMEVNEAEVTSVLTELHTVSDDHPRLVVAVVQLVLARCLSCMTPYSHEAVSRALISILVYSKANAESEATLRNLETTFTDVSNKPEFILDPVPTLACQSMIMSFGERFCAAKKWHQAASWYILCTHPAFNSTAESSFPKCLRKAALCFLQAGDYAKASTTIQRCPPNEAPTHYVKLLIAIHRGMEEEAITAVRAMVKAPEFDRRLLLLATQLAHEAHLKALLITILDALLASLRCRPDTAGGIEAIVLIRCIIRLILDQMKDPVNDIPALVDALVTHMRTARDYAKDALAAGQASTLHMDLSWLWRIAYNAAVEGCSGWDEDSVCELFDISVELMDACQATSVTGYDREIGMHKVFSSFAAVCGRVFCARRASDGPQRISLREKILTDLAACKDLIRSTRQQPAIDEAQRDRLGDIFNTALVFQVEQLSQLARWEPVMETIQEASQISNVGPHTLEMIADLLWVDDSCPSDVLQVALEAILHASLDRQYLSLRRFSRWLRAICGILLIRNKSSDRNHAIQYMKQAAELLTGEVDDADVERTYPQDERQWLLSTAFNTGVDVFRQSNWEEAKSWFELAASLCRFVENGEEIRGKISKAYSDLLAKFAPPL